MLHFAYGSNMNRSVMQRHAPRATPVGVATLDDHRFIIGSDGYASVAAVRGGLVHGVLWRLNPSDYAGLAIWEGLAAGQYRIAKVPVQCAGRRLQALIYIARKTRGRSRPVRRGYMDVVIAAALEWRLPQAYVEDLRGFLPRQHHQMAAAFSG